MSLWTWLIVGALMLLCGLAMARLMWIADRRPPLRPARREPHGFGDSQPEAQS